MKAQKMEGQSGKIYLQYMTQNSSYYYTLSAQKPEK